MVVLALTAMPTLLADPRNAAGINHLVIVGPVAGGVLATLGAAVATAGRPGAWDA